jgi:hypothetical protein
MDVAGIGVQTITATTGTAAQNSNPAPDRANDNDRNDASAQRVNPSAASGTGNIVDKTV